MSRTLRFLLLLALAPVPTLAQATTPPNTREIWATLRYDLRTMTTAQERFYSSHDRYARSVSEMVDAGVFNPSDGVTMVIILSSKTGWTVVAVDDRVPGLVCGMFVGRNYTSPLQDDAVEGMPSCITPDG